MVAVFLERIGLALITLVIIAVVVFFALELMLEACRTRMGLDQPPLWRFAAWAGDILRGDLGVSMQRERPIGEIVGWRLRNTLILAAVTATVGIPLALGLGVLAGLKPDGPLDMAISGIAIFAMTVPEFISGTLMILVFSVILGWAAGVVTIGYKAPALDLVQASLLPAATLVMQSDFVQMARLKGVPQRRIIWHHVVPNALLPAISIIGLTMAWLLGGVVIVESVFNYPGLGRLAVDAVADQDLPLVQAIALLFGLIYVLTNLGADLLALALNPRLRTRRG
jgi:peptide/nickel transport system permease protein